ncbi:MAG: cobalamin-binding protein [Candidatus Omnitrophica bacterium]|nr:cobalamin-binding protein [Candidatus Omnitrophota bacterium]MBU4488385.1 cobalamin-binding protein [Candidatus Omnitrophota bacterium]MCG2705020.1 cobalamin-binding protein [Candidatus Omnitrophota bacterium]
MKKYICLLVLALLIIHAETGEGAGEPQNLRIISLAPATTEILFALGLDDEIVGVSSFCDYPEEAKGKEKVGTFSYLNAEKILSLKPDIIFGTGLEQASAVTMLRGLGLRLYVSDPVTIEELLFSIKEIGKLTGRSREAEKLTKKMRDEMIRLSRRAGTGEDRPKVFIEIWDDPLLTAGGKSFINELITLAGGVNIAGDMKKAYGYFSAEQVIKRDPDYIILTYMSEERPLDVVKKRLGWSDISAVRMSRVYNDIDSDILLRPGPRLIEGLKALERRITRKDE